MLFIRMICKGQLPVLHRTCSRTLDSDQRQLLPAEHAVFWPSHKTTDSIALEAGSPQASHRKSKSGLVSRGLSRCISTWRVGQELFEGPLY